MEEELPLSNAEEKRYCLILESILSHCDLFDYLSDRKAALDSLMKLLWSKINKVTSAGKWSHAIHILNAAWNIAEYSTDGALNFLLFKYKCLKMTKQWNETLACLSQAEKYTTDPSILAMMQLQVLSELGGTDLALAQIDLSKLLQCSYLSYSRVICAVMYALDHNNHLLAASILEALLTEIWTGKNPNFKSIAAKDQMMLFYNFLSLFKQGIEDKKLEPVVNMAKYFEKRIQFMGEDTFHSSDDNADPSLEQDMAIIRWIVCNLHDISRTAMSSRQFRVAAELFQINSSLLDTMVSAVEPDASLWLSKYVRIMTL